MYNMLEQVIHRRNIVISILESMEGADHETSNTILIALHFHSQYFIIVSLKMFICSYTLYELEVENYYSSHFLYRTFCLLLTILISFARFS